MVNNFYGSDRNSEVLPLSILSREALLHGLSEGISVTFDEKITNPLILSDDEFWNKLLSEAHDRRLLSDTFLRALCESGIPPRSLILKGGRGDVALSDRWLFGGGKSGEQIQRQTGDVAALSFSSACDMLLASLVHLRLSDIRTRSAGVGLRRRVEYELFDKSRGYLSLNSDSVNNLFGENSSQLVNALHKIARTCINLECLEVGPFAGSTEQLHGLTGALKAISASCLLLRSIKFNGLTLRGDHTGSNSIGKHLSFFESFSENCKGTLEILSLSKCLGVHDIHVQSLLLHESGCPNLQSINLGFTGIGNLTFSALIRRNTLLAENKIQTLVLDGTRIDLQWLKQIVCSSLGDKLERLSLLACPLLDSGIDTWEICANNLRNLKRLDIELWFLSGNLIENPIEEVFQQVSDHIDLGYGQGWACVYCTFINEDNMLRCEMCNGQRYCPQDIEPEPVDKVEVHSFSPFKAPLKECSIIVHIDEESTRLSMQASLAGRNYEATILKARENDGDDIISHECSTNACTAFVTMALSNLPPLHKLNISMQSGHSFNLDDKNVVSLSKHAMMESLTLDPVVIISSSVVENMLSCLNHIKVLKLIGYRDLGVTSSDVLRCISEQNSRNQLMNLESLDVTIHDSGSFVNLEEVVDRFVSSSTKQSLQNEITFVSTSIKHFFMHGCASIRRLILCTPDLLRLHISQCPSLSIISFDETIGKCSNKIEKLRLCRNISLDSHSIALMQLPCLQSLHIDDMSTLQDWQLAGLIKTTKSLTSIRLHECQSLGKCSEWEAFGPTRFLNLFHLFQPSLSFDISAFQFIFSDHASQRIRDLRVEKSFGLQGTLSGLGVSHELPEKEVISRIDQGAFDEEGENPKELLGIRGIQRKLSNFIHRALAGEEMGFPPTLNSLQRKLVHELAEAMNLEHQTAILNNGIKVVRVKKKEINDIFGEFLADNRVPIAPQNIWEREDHNREYEVDFGDNIDEHVVERNDSNANDGNLIQAFFDIESNIEGGVELEIIESILRDYIAGSESNDNLWYGFPSCLSAYQRKLVHEMADDFSLEHESVELSDGHKAVRIRRHEESIEVEQVVLEFDGYERPMSRKASRKARKKERKKEKEGKKKLSVEDDDDDSYISEDEINLLLQCEERDRIDPKSLRQLCALSNQLPCHEDSGKAICLRYLCKICPFMENESKCDWGHFEVSKSSMKRFGSLFDIVCGQWGNEFTNRQQKKYRRSASRRSKSFGTDSDIDSEDELNSSRSKGKRKSKGRVRRKSSATSDYEAEMDDDTRSACSGRSYTSANSSMMTKQYYDKSLPPTYIPEPLHLQRLMNLDILDCDGITGVYFEAPYLVRCCIRDCSSLKFVNLVNANALTTLDLTDCANINNIPLFGSYRCLRVALFTCCKSLDISFMLQIVKHCRQLQSLHIFGSGASEKASNAKSRQKVKTKAGLAKLNAGRPNLEIITTKKEWRERIMKKSMIGDEIGLVQGEDP